MHARAGDADIHSGGGHATPAQRFSRCVAMWSAFRNRLVIAADGAVMRCFRVPEARGTIPDLIIHLIVWIGTKVRTTCTCLCAFSAKTPVVLPDALAVLVIAPVCLVIVGVSDYGCVSITKFLAPLGQSTGRTLRHQIRSTYTAIWWKFAAYLFAPKIITRHYHISLRRHTGPYIQSLWRLRRFIVLLLVQRVPRRFVRPERGPSARLPSVEMHLRVVLPARAIRLEEIEGVVQAYLRFAQVDIDRLPRSPIAVLLHQ